MQRKICGNPDIRFRFASANPLRWTKKELTYAASNVTVPGVTAAQFQALFGNALAAWCATVGVKSRAANTASPRWWWLWGARETPDITVTAKPIDGPGEVLAWSYLPDGRNSQVQQAYDNGDNWALGPLSVTDERVDIYAVILHELGHAMGLEHSDDPDDLMYPYYTPLIRSLQHGDIKRIRDLYGVK